MPAAPVRGAPPSITPPPPQPVGQAPLAHASPGTGRAFGKNSIPPSSHAPQRSAPNLDMAVVDRNSDKNLILFAAGFVVFYLAVATAIFLNNQRAATNAANEAQLRSAERISDQVAMKIEGAISWMDNSIASGKSARDSAMRIASSPGFDGAAIFNAKGALVATYPETAQALSGAPIGDGPEGSVSINSLIAEDGVVTPVVIKKSGNYFVVASFSDGALLDKSSASAKSALIAPSGRIIDAHENIVRQTLQTSLGIAPGDMKAFARAGPRMIEKRKIDGRSHQLAMIKVPNSSLMVVQAKRSLEFGGELASLGLLILLFLGTMLTVGLLLRTLFQQMTQMRDVQRSTEVSQQRFQAVVESERGGVWEADLVANQAYLSASLAGLLNLGREDITMPLSQFISMFHQQDREKFLALMRRTHMQGGFEIEMHVAQLPLILQCRGRPSARSGSDGGRVILGMAVDVTAQHGAKVRLQAAESRLHNALSSMTDSLVVWDQLDRVVIWNRKFEEFFGLQPGQLEPGMERPTVEYLVKNAIKDVNEIEGMDGWLEIVLADDRWLRYVETPTSEGGRVSVGTDISEIRKHEAELKQNEKQLRNTVNVLHQSQEGILKLAQRYEDEKIRAEDANQSKSDFLANMSHELRTPLNAINGFSDIMKKELFGPLGDPRYKEYVNDILFSGKHLLALINDILDMSKIEAGKMNLNTEMMLMHEMIASVVRILRGRADEEELHLIADVPDVRAIEADPRAVKQVLLNLMTNAIKFTPKGGTVRVEVIEKQSGLIVKVHDSGIGIPQEDIERLAKPFEQVVDENTKHQEGTGLGLALSKSLIELHGGNFKMESEVGKGTTVIFSLPNTPIKPAEEPVDTEVSDEITRLASDIADVLSGEEASSEPEPDDADDDQTAAEDETQAPHADEPAGQDAIPVVGATAPAQSPPATPAAAETLPVNPYQTAAVASVPPAPNPYKARLAPYPTAQPAPPQPSQTAPAAPTPYPYAKPNVPAA